MRPYQSGYINKVISINARYGISFYADDIEKAINKIILQLQSSGEREVPSKWVGELVMEALKTLDKVAYIRFASVYLSFKDIEEFIKEIDKLRE